MAQTVGDLLSKIKTSCDNRTLMFCFKNTNTAKAYNRTLLYTPWESRVKPVLNYAKYNSDKSFSEWDKNTIAAAGYVAFDSRDHNATTTVKIEYTGTPADVATIKKTTTTVVEELFNGTSNTTVTTVYTYNGLNYTTPVQGSLDRPVFGAARDEYTTEETITTKNSNYLKVYKYTPDSIGNYSWEATSYTAVFKTETLTSGNIDSYYAYQNADDTYYRKDILVRSIRTPVLNIYYKNSQGVWVDYYACIRTYPEYDVDESSRIWTERLKVDTSLLPKCEYIDENGYRFFIDAGDGEDANAETCTSIELETVRSRNALSREVTFDITSSTDVLTFLSGEVPPTAEGFKFSHWSYVKDGSAITSASNRNLAVNDTLTVYAVYYRETDIVEYVPYSIENPNLPWKQRFMYDDLKITMPEGYTKRQFLVWLNGAFVPSMRDATYDNIMYLQNAMTMIGSKSVNQKLGSKFTDGEYGTANVSEENDEYRYDINLRLFGWRGVRVSDFYKPVSSTTTPITYNFESIYPLKTLTFPVEVNPNAYMVICNGKVLSPDDYYIDTEDPKTIVLKNIETDSNNLLNELVTELDENIEFYENVNPLHLLRSMILERTYSLVNFEAEDSTKELYLKYSNACAVDFPMKGEVSFSKLSIGDLVLVDGIFEPYLWVHQNTIKFPKMETSYNDGIADKIYAENISRYYFLLKDK